MPPCSLQSFCHIKLYVLFRQSVSIFRVFQEERRLHDDCEGAVWFHYRLNDNGWHHWWVPWQCHVDGFKSNSRWRHTATASWWRGSLQDFISLLVCLYVFGFVMLVYCVSLFARCLRTPTYRERWTTLLTSSAICDECRTALTRTWYGYLVYVHVINTVHTYFVVVTTLWLYRIIVHVHPAIVKIDQYRHDMTFSRFFIKLWSAWRTILQAPR